MPAWWYRSAPSRQPAGAHGAAPGRRRPAIGDHEGPPGLQALEAGVAEDQRRAPPRLRLGQHEVEQARRLLPRAVEGGQPPVAVAEQAQRRRRAVQRVGEVRRRLDARAVQQVADLDEVLQRQQQDAGAALHMGAVGQDLAVDLGGQQLEAAGEPGLLLERDGRGQRALERHQRAAVPCLGRQARHQHAGVGGEPRHQRPAEPVLGGGRREVPVAEPGGEPRPRHLRRLGQGIGAGRLQPVAGDVAGVHAGGVRAERAQVAQPGEAVQRRPPNRATGPGAEGAGVVGQGPDGAGHLQLPVQQALAAGGVAGPEVAEGARRGIGHAARA